LNIPITISKTTPTTVSTEEILKILGIKAEAKQESDKTKSYKKP
jgi:hypothetical protein